jgi:hypothetical protein
MAAQAKHARGLRSPPPWTSAPPEEAALSTAPGRYYGPPHAAPGRPAGHTPRESPRESTESSLPAAAPCPRVAAARLPAIAACPRAGAARLHTRMPAGRPPLRRRRRAPTRHRAHRAAGRHALACLPPEGCPDEQVLRAAVGAPVRRWDPFAPGQLTVTVVRRELTYSGPAEPPSSTPYQRRGGVNGDRRTRASYFRVSTKSKGGRSSNP